MSFAVEIPSVFTKPTQIPIRLGNTILSGNETINGALSVNGSLTFNKDTNISRKVVYYDSFDISNLNVGNATVTGQISSNTITTNNLDISGSFIHSNTTKPLTINSEQSGIQVRSNNPFFYDIVNQGRRRQNLIQWRNNSTVYAGIYLNGPTTGGGTGVFDISDNMIFNLEFQTLNDTNFGTRMTVDNAGILTCTELTTTSDDRLKTELQPISNATQTITKLTPQTYHKYNTMDGCGNYRFESGFIAQEIYYNASELRHLVHTKADISGHIDSDYWGSTPASVNYIGIIPYLIQAIKEQQDLIQKQREIIQKEEAYDDLLNRIQVLENNKKLCNI